MEKSSDILLLLKKEISDLVPHYDGKWVSKEQVMKIIENKRTEAILDEVMSHSKHGKEF